MNKKIYLASPHMSDEGYEQEYVKEAFDTNWIAPLGENVNKFEEELASYVGTKYAAALSAGTAAIHMAFKALDVKEGDIVFCSSLTFSATANPITYQNATPVFIDSEPETWNMDPKALEKAFEKYPHPKAVIVVHLYGTPAKIEEIAGQQQPDPPGLLGHRKIPQRRQRQKQQKLRRIENHRYSSDDLYVFISSPCRA